MIQINSWGRFCILLYTTHNIENFPYEYIQVGRVHAAVNNGIYISEDASEWKCFCIPR